MELRDLFSSIFKTKKNVSRGTQLQMLNGFSGIFTSYNGRIYDSIDVRACIDTIARNGAKLNPKHVRDSKDEFIIHDGDNLMRIISEQPNELMNAYDFYYKVISQLYLNNNAFIYIQRDEQGKVTGLYPIKAGTEQLLEYAGEVYIRFNFGSGQYYTASLKDDVIHLKRFFCENEIMGGNTVPITKTMSLKHVLDEGLINAIKTTQGIKGILKTTKTMLKPEDIKATRDQFVKDFIAGQQEDGTGIAGLDANTEFQTVDMNPRTATDGQIKEVADEVKNYFNISDEIIQSKYTEEQWNAFYESVIEPIGIQLSLEFTNKLFTLGERNHGNKIIFEANRLQYASNNTKINIIKEAGMLGLITINEAREILNLPPVTDGDKRLQSLNYIDSNIANQYQGAEEAPVEENGGSNEE